MKKIFRSKYVFFLLAFLITVTLLLGFGSFENILAQDPGDSCEEDDECNYIVEGDEDYDYTDSVTYNTHGHGVAILETEVNCDSGSQLCAEGGTEILGGGSGNCKDLNQKFCAGSSGAEDPDGGDQYVRETYYSVSENSEICCELSDGEEEDCHDYTDPEGGEAFCVDENSDVECQSTPEARNLQSTNYSPEDYCGEYNPPTKQLSWDYYSPTGDDQNEVEVEVATDSGFTTVVEDQTYTIESGESNIEQHTIQEDLDFDTDYYWRVRIIDENENEGDWSTGSFSTGIERCKPDFQWVPHNPYPEEVTDFYNETEEGHLDVVEYRWDFDNADISESLEEGFSPDPIEVYFEEEGNHEVVLEAEEEDGVVCEETKYVPVGHVLPDWREVDPFR